MVVSHTLIKNIILRPSEWSGARKLLAAFARYTPTIKTTDSLRVARSFLALLATRLSFAMGQVPYCEWDEIQINLARQIGKERGV